MQRIWRNSSNRLAIDILEASNFTETGIFILQLFDETLAGIHSFRDIAQIPTFGDIKANKAFNFSWNSADAIEK